MILYGTASAHSRAMPSAARDIRRVKPAEDIADVASGQYRADASIIMPIHSIGYHLIEPGRIVGHACPAAESA